MLYELEPSVEITGGAWYTGSEFDTEFVDALATQCFKYISSKASF
jgi:DNA-directed RNA polymerase III subunit RPC6